MSKFNNFILCDNQQILNYTDAMLPVQLIAPLNRQPSLGVLRDSKLVLVSLSCCYRLCGCTHN